MHKAIPYDVRWGIRKDMPWIEDANTQHLVRFSETANVWTTKETLAHLQKRNWIMQVAVDERDRCVGCIVYSLHEDHLIVEYLMVHPDHRRKGIGTRLLHILKEKLSPHRRTYFAFYVDERDLDTLLFARQALPSVECELVDDEVEFFYEYRNFPIS